MSKTIIIVGAGGHGKVVADIAQKNGYTEILFLDDDATVKECGRYPVVGTCKKALEYRNADFIVAIGNSMIRQKIQRWLDKNGLKIVSLIHPNAVVSETVDLGKGSVVMAGVVINPSVKIGEGNIINTCSSVDHDCTVGNFVHISIGAHIAGGVSIGDRTWVGAGVTVINNINITKDCIIGAGAVVIRNLTKTDTYVGVPAKIKV